MIDDWKVALNADQTWAFFKLYPSAERRSARARATVRKRWIEFDSFFSTHCVMHNLIFSVPNHTPLLGLRSIAKYKQELKRKRSGQGGPAAAAEGRGQS